MAPGAKRLGCQPVVPLAGFEQLTGLRRADEPLIELQRLRVAQLAVEAPVDQPFCSFVDHSSCPTGLKPSRPVRRGAIAAPAPAVFPPFRPAGPWPRRSGRSSSFPGAAE